MSGGVHGPLTGDPFFQGVKAQLTETMALAGSQALVLKSYPIGALGPGVDLAPPLESLPSKAPSSISSRPINPTPLEKPRDAPEPPTECYALPPRTDPNASQISNGLAARTGKTGSDGARIVTPVVSGVRGELTATDISSHVGLGTLDLGISSNNGLSSLGATWMPTRLYGNSIGVFGRAWSESMLGGVNYAALDGAGGRHKFELSGTLSRKARDLGELGGRLAKRIARLRGVDLEKEGLRRVELRHQVNGGGSVGSAWLLAGSSAKLDLARGKDIIYRTHTTRQTAAELLESYRDDLWDGLGTLLGRSKRTPDLHHPARMQIGDELEVQTSGTFYSALAAGAAGMYVGGQGLVRGDLGILVRKIAPGRVQVTFTPHRITGKRGFLALAPGGQASFGKYNTKTYKQTFEFNLRTASGLAAYHAAVEGELPCRLNDIPPCGAGMPEEVQLAYMIKRENALLPRGVRRLCMEQVETPQVRSSIGLRWYWLPRWPGGVLTTWGRGTNTASKKETVVDGCRIVTTHTEDTESYSESFWGGIRSVNTFAKQRWMTVFEPAKEDAPPVAKRTFLGVLTRVRFYADHIDTAQLDDAFVSNVNRALGNILKPFNASHRDRRRQIDIYRTFSAQDLMALAAMGDPASDINIQRGCARGADPTKLQTLLRALHERRGLEPVSKKLYEMSLVLEKYVADNGLSGMGALNALLGDDPKEYHVDTESGVYRKPLDRAQTLCLQHAKPLNADFGRADLRKRFGEVEKVLRDLSLARKMLVDDPYLKEKTRSDVLRKITVAENNLRQVISTDHLSSEALLSMRRTMENSWWVTSQDKRIIAYLGGTGDVTFAIRDVMRPAVQAHSAWFSAFVDGYGGACHRGKGLLKILDNDVLRTEERRKTERNDLQQSLDALDRQVRFIGRSTSMRGALMEALGSWWWFYPGRTRLRQQALGEHPICD